MVCIIWSLISIIPAHVYNQTDETHHLLLISVFVNKYIRHFDKNTFFQQDLLS